MVAQRDWAYFHLQMKKLRSEEGGLVGGAKGSPVDPVLMRKKAAASEERGFALHPGLSPFFLGSVVRSTVANDAGCVRVVSESARAESRAERSPDSSPPN